MVWPIMKKQAKSFGVEFMTIDGVKKIEADHDLKVITLSNESALQSHAIILAPGGRPRMLNVEGETSFGGKGISYCATCDGDFFTDKKIVVVGGGNAALEEAVSLTKYASSVTIVHMFDHFQAFPFAIEEAIKHPKIDIRMETVVEKFYGDEKLEAVSLKDLKTGLIEHFPTDGAFIFIGYQPNTEFLGDLPILNKHGEILVNKDMQTTIPGIFAAGDSTEKKYRQISTAIGDGTIAALSVAAYVHEQHSISQPLINQSV